ncbi:MAG: hypothetical protein CO103_00730 [Chloroflexi bacterium CG_4_9_14_3_um_filter_45_9]|nr:MAG: hypothetical protein CO103_00730 [Chloroflexi bacterium CG_4_9_14_3_um_filter_45_9]
MALSQGVLDLSGLKANADLNSYQYYFVKAGSVTGEVAVNATAAGSVLGVLQNDPRQGEEAQVRVLGTTKLRITSEASGSPVTFGGFIKSSSTGMGCGSINFAASAFNAVAISLGALASGSGTYIEALLMPPTRVAG